MSSPSNDLQTEPRIERLTDADFDDVVDLTLARFPDNERSEAAFPLGETFSGGRVLLGAREGADLVGYAIKWQAGWLPVSEWIVRVVVAPGREGRGIGGRLWSRIREHVPADATALRVGIRDDETCSVEVARHWGFTVNVHSMESRLALDVSTGAGSEAPAPPAGVTVEPCDDLEFADLDAVERMFRACQTDPEALRGQPMTLDQMRTVPEGAVARNLLARVDGAPAGITCTAVTGSVQWVYYTGIDPAFRGRGLAKLLKQHAHVAGAASGATECRTSNVEENEGIRRINAELGYVVHTGIYRMVRHLPAS